MSISIWRVYKYHFVTLVITTLFLITSCDTSYLTKSAQELTGGNGAGLSEYQSVP
jgi:hypothetical protein